MGGPYLSYLLDLIDQSFKMLILLREYLIEEIVLGQLLSSQRI